MSEERVAYTGSLDMATIPEAVALVEQAARSHQEICLDLAGLAFIDSTGVRGLIVLKRKLAEDGRKLCFDGFRPEILEILDILGVRELLLGD
ncbi:MAG TPA: STAS domain-containing protein [Symbiobacteriaceae bacterium]|jgi:anti-sigma B factor antagonist/stage II sporulation protein AA (anti-sigma F factor antagonist)